MPYSRHHHFELGLNCTSNTPANRPVSEAVNSEQEFALAIRAIASVHESDPVEIYYWCFVLPNIDRSYMGRQLKSVEHKAIYLCYGSETSQYIKFHSYFIVVCKLLYQSDIFILNDASFILPLGFEFRQILPEKLIRSVDA